MGGLGSLLPASRQPCPSYLGSPPHLLGPQWSPPPRVCSPCPTWRPVRPLASKLSPFGNSSSPLLSVKPGALRPCSVTTPLEPVRPNHPSCPDPPPSPIPLCLSPDFLFLLSTTSGPFLLAALLAGGSSCKPKLPTSLPLRSELALSPHHDSLHPCLRVPIVP